MAKKGITVGLNINNKSEDFNELMIELENLCSACDIDVVGLIEHFTLGQVKLRKY